MNIINDKYLKEFSPIPLNYNTKEVKNYVEVAQIIWVRPILGDAFMDEIEYQVEKNKVSDENSTLLVEALYPYLAYATVLEALPFIWAHISEVGVTLGKSDNSDSLSLKDMTYVQNHIRNQVEARKDFLIKWLDERAESFRLYHPSNCCCDAFCAKIAKLKAPNPSFKVFGLRKIDANLK